MCVRDNFNKLSLLHIYKEIERKREEEKERSLLKIHKL